MLRVTLIRHFATYGNLQKKYIGITDAPLCAEGKSIAQRIQYPKVEAVFSSPMRRCVETAKLIYPEHTPLLHEDLRECDFGEFENKNYNELRNNTKYQEWVDSNGTLSFPGGEDNRHFKARSVKAFDEMIRLCLEKGVESIGGIVHGGTIMSILDQYSYPQRAYFHWQVGNGCGYNAVMYVDEGRLSDICTIH